jgi:acetyl esterase/lipase
MPAFHPDLRRGRFIPRFSYGPTLVSIMSRLNPRPAEAPDDIDIEDMLVPGPAGDVALRIYRPTSLSRESPALYWMHGGGFLIGSPLQDERSNIDFARELNMSVIAVTYRLAPEAPAPAAVEDAYAGLEWVWENARDLGIDRERIAIGGASAGGGLAASLALYALDKGEITPAFQLLVYPMLDDRTATRTDLDTKGVRVWTPGSNRYAWTTYLGHEPGLADASPYAAPARRDDLSGLPPAWIGVGTLDLFFDEDVAYAQRLEASDVPCETYIVRGAFHGFDALFPSARVSTDFWREQAGALSRALFPAP